MNRNVIWIAILATVLTACVIGQKSNYHEGKSDFASKFRSDQSLFVIVIDKRPYVLSGNKRNTFTGLLRSLYGIPYPTYTESGNPLSVDLSGLLERSLQPSADETSKSLALDPNENIRKSITENAQPKDKVLVFSFTEWKADISGVGNGLFHYDIVLDVRDDDGNLLARTVQTGKEVFKVKKDPLANAIARVINRLITQDDIVESVNNPDAVAKTDAETSIPSDQTVDDRSCTVEQILEMEKIDISKEQIQAACD